MPILIINSSVPGKLTDSSWKSSDNNDGVIGSWTLVYVTIIDTPINTIKDETAATMIIIILACQPRTSVQ
jgi:hypothetical protein